MTEISRIRVMISSRCNDNFPASKAGRTLSEIRKRLKAMIEAEQLFGVSIFDVWINEDAPPAAGTEDGWEHCLRQAKQCDILIVLSNGNAGWAKTGGEIGICHAEMEAALAKSPGKVRLITIGNTVSGSADEKRRNKLFQDFIERQGLFRVSARDEDELKDKTKSSLAAAVVDLTHLGVREVSRGKYHSGAALDWTRLGFADRQKAMRHILQNAISSRMGGTKLGEHVVLRVDGTAILFALHAIPGALSVPKAREMVGQPFLKDHESSEKLDGKRGGPVHVIACHKSVTESQAMRLLGFPDATIVNAPFGIFVADSAQKVQMALLANCRDESSTRHAVQRFFEWLNQTGEAKDLVKRATSRAKIVRVIAAECS